MGSGFSRRNKETTEQQTENHPQKKSVCSNCGCKNANDGQNAKNDTKSDRTNENIQVLNVDKERDEKVSKPDRKTFYYYPTKEATDDETLYVTTSQFPYSKPKAVVVRQQVVPDGIKVNDLHFQNTTENDINLKAPQYPKLNAALQEHLGVNDGVRPYHIVNERRWSSANVLPSSGFASQHVLPHRAVAELRRHSYPVSDHYDGFYSYNCQFSGSGRRPPTPSPTAWYPARRSDDYLVAPSLLAMERERDRKKQEELAKSKIRRF